MPETKKERSKFLKIRKAKKQISDLNKQIDQKLKDLQKIRKACLFPFFSGVEITPSIVDDIFDDLRNNYKDCNGHLDVIIDSGGGDIDAAYNLSMLFRKFGSKELNFIVPRWAKSAATLLVCSGNKILMSPVAELGPLDPQITQINPLEGRMEQFSPLHIRSTLEMIREEFDSGNEKLATVLMERLQFPITLGGFVKSSEIGQQYVTRLLETRMLSDPKEKNTLENVAKQLDTGYANHGFCINIDEAKSLGLKVCELGDDELNIVWELHRLNSKKGKIEDEIREDDIMDKIKSLPPGLLDKLPPVLREKLQEVTPTINKKE
jgi:hypothetical protein